MSTIAPWFALAIDWQESEMFDDSSHGVRLAWVCLLCFAKAQGRAGKVRVRVKKFADDYRLSVEVVEELLARAGRDGAVTVDGGYVTVVNWKSYQDPKARSKDKPKSKPRKQVTSKRKGFSKSTENDATHHPPPSTQHPPPPAPAGDEWAEVEEVLFGFGVAKAPEAVRSVRDAGCNVTQVRNLIEFWRSNQPRWGVGALYDRLMVFRPVQNFDQLWPPAAGNGKTAIEVEADVFDEYFRTGKFTDKPIRHATDPRWWWAFLKDGTRVSCKNVPEKRKR